MHWQQTLKYETKLILVTKKAKLHFLKAREEKNNRKIKCSCIGNWPPYPGTYPEEED